MLHLRRKRPKGVMRGSFLILKTGPFISFIPASSALRSSASMHIERNL